MTHTIFTATSFGTSAKIIEVEAAFTKGMPQFNITGLAHSSILESKQRVLSALANSDITLPPLKVNINLSPSDLPKSGGHFDLPIALALQKNTQDDGQWFAFGELGLDGSIKYLDSIYPLLLDIALLYPQAKVFVPLCAKDLLSLIPNVCFYFVSHLKEAIDILNNPLLDSHISTISQDLESNSQTLGFKSIEIAGEQYFYDDNFMQDFAEVKGQHIAKRAALIAAAGFHNFMMEGSPGCGKSMIAKRLLYILPPSSLQEMIENVKHQSLNKQSVAYTPLRPFRNPHQSASKSSILGSATQFEAKPGEIALAHNGILFFDELPHFKKDILESLREPLENNKLVVSRVHSKLEYDTSFLFVAALNPCPCGNLLSKSKECRCQEREINAYRTRISEPLLDRIDLFVQMSEYEEDALLSPINLDSAHMQKMVFDAFALQKSRRQTIFNGKLDEREITLFCMLNDECEALLQQASERFSLSYRAQNKVKKVARTIADLANETHIQKPHILEALSYRRI